MNKEIVDSCLAHARAFLSHPIAPAMRLDHETILTISTTVPENRCIRNLFGVADRNGPPFYTQVQCNLCKSLREEPLHKTNLVFYMEELRRIHLLGADVNFVSVSTCDKCKKDFKAKKEESENRRSKEKSDAVRLQMEKNTTELCTCFLLPNNQPSNKSTWKHAEERMQQLIYFCYQQHVEEKIKSMEYNDFLRTPYWRIVAHAVKRKHRFKCVMCNSSNNLRVHHKNYDFHGKEHTYEGMASLTCVCESCHSKHHGHHE